MSTPSSGNDIREIAIAQKLILFSILINISMMVARAILPGLQNLIGLAFFVTMIAQAYGCYRLVRGLKYETPMVVLWMILMFIPCISLIALVILNQKATEALRAAGLKVGLLGANMPDLP